MIGREDRAGRLFDEGKVAQMKSHIGVRLTEREREVLSGILDGLTNHAIGDGLAISTRTVELHRARILLKTECASTVELVRLATWAGF